jgi:predicted metalloprotease with PDZ domain
MNCRNHIVAVRVALICAIFLSAASAFPTVAQEKELSRITYRLAMTRPASHLFEVSIEVETENGFPSDSLEFQMPRWAPGRYAIFDFAKNVQEFRASLACLPENECSEGKPTIVRVDNQTWQVDVRGARSVTVGYKVFGNDLSGTFSQLDTRHATINGGSVFMYLVGQKQRPVSLEIDPPANWRIVNGRMESADQRLWQFPNYDLLMDTPTEVAPDWTVDEFKIDGKTYRVVVHSFGNEGGKRAEFVREVEKIVRTELAMWGAPDFESYTFLIHFANDDRSNDGMEHLTSTQIIDSGELASVNSFYSALDTVAHEFFHVWNVKRLRPVELGPWDFTRPVNTRAMWITEGLTNYYGHLMQRRAGIWDDEQFWSTLTAYIGSIENAPGSKLMSAEDSSISAPFLDGAVHAQRTNLANTSFSYYNKGETLGLVLDLLIRGKTKGRASLDDVMRRMYDQFYVKGVNTTYYLRGRGYTSEDFERVTSEIAGRDMSDFFRRYVRSVEAPPYDEAFAYVGLRLVRVPDGGPLSAGITAGGATPLLVKSVRPGSAAASAGLLPEDEIVSIDGKAVTHQTWLVALGRHKPGDQVLIALRREGKTVQASLILEAESFRYRIVEAKDATPEMRALRAAWVKG